MIVSEIPNYILYTIVALLATFVLLRPSPSIALEPEEQVFVAAYIDAINSKSVEKLKKLIHPDSLACMNENNKDYFDEIFKKDMLNTLPIDTKFLFSKDVLTMYIQSSEFMVFPVTPNYQLQVDYGFSSPSEIKSFTKIIPLLKQGDRIFEVLACPTEKGFAKFREVQAIKDKQVEQKKEKYEHLPVELKSELLAMLKAGQKIEAIKYYREKTGDGLFEARDAIDYFQKEMRK